MLTISTAQSGMPFKKGSVISIGGPRKRIMIRHDSSSFFAASTCFLDFSATFFVGRLKKVPEKCYKTPENERLEPGKDWKRPLLRKRKNIDPNHQFLGVAGSFSGV